MKSSLRILAAFSHCLLVSAQLTTPNHPHPELHNGIACISNKLTIYYLDGFTSHTYITDGATVAAAFHDLDQDPARAAVTTAPPSLQDVDTDTDTDEEMEGAAREEKRKVIPVWSKHVFVCSVVGSDDKWTSRFTPPNWLPTGVVTATLNTWVTTTQLTTVQTSYGRQGTSIAPPERPIVTVRPRLRRDMTTTATATTATTTATGGDGDEDGSGMDSAVLTTSVTTITVTVTRTLV